MGLAHEKKSYLQGKANLFEIGSELKTESWESVEAGCYGRTVWRSSPEITARVKNFVFEHLTLTPTFFSSPARLFWFRIVTSNGNAYIINSSSHSWCFAGSNMAFKVEPSLGFIDICFRKPVSSDEYMPELLAFVQKCKDAENLSYGNYLTDSKTLAFEWLLAMQTMKEYKRIEKISGAPETLFTFMIDGMNCAYGKKDFSLLTKYFRIAANLSLLKIPEAKRQQMFSQYQAFMENPNLPSWVKEDLRNSWGSRH